MKPKICVISGSRAEYGLLRNLLFPLQKSKLLNLQFIVTGSHLSSKHGKTISEIQEDSIKIDEQIEILSEDDSSIGIADSISKAIEISSRALTKLKPDMILVLGDRYEIFSVSIAAMILNIPISHIHGGELTEAAIDEAIRHSLTKMSYFHFVTTAVYKKRVIQLGEDPERVFFVGGLGIDSIKNISLLSKKQLEKKFKIKLNKTFLMITYHSVTLERENNLKTVRQLLKALNHFKDSSLIFTAPNADPGGSEITKIIKAFTDKNKNAHFFTSVGQIGYLSFLKEADGVVGNSSSGILEAPYCGVGSVNIGDRQKGRLKPKSVVDVNNDEESIKNGINTILSEDFRRSIENQHNPFGDGNAGVQIVKILEQELNKPNKKTFLKKAFFNLTPQSIIANGFWYK